MSGGASEKKAKILDWYEKRFNTYMPKVPMRLIHDPQYGNMVKTLIISIAKNNGQTMIGPKVSLSYPFQDFTMHVQRAILQCFHLRYAKYVFQQHRQSLRQKNVLLGGGGGDNTGRRKIITSPPAIKNVCARFNKNMLNFRNMIYANRPAFATFNYKTHPQYLPFFSDGKRPVDHILEDSQVKLYDLDPSIIEPYVDYYLLQKNVRRRLGMRAINESITSDGERVHLSNFVNDIGQCIQRYNHLSGPIKHVYDTELR